MPKPSEIFDTPEATGFSRVGDNKKPLRICNKTGVHTCRLGSIHLNEREALILGDYLTTKDQEKEEAVKKERSRILKEINDSRDHDSCECDNCHRWRKYYKKALPTEDNT